MLKYLCVAAARKRILVSKICRAGIIPINHPAVLEKPIREYVIVMHEAMYQGCVRQFFRQCCADRFILPIVFWKNRHPPLNRGRNEESFGPVACKRLDRSFYPISIISSNVDASVMAAHNG